MKELKIELKTDNGFAQPLYYDLEYGESSISYFTFYPSEISKTIKIEAEEGGHHLSGTPMAVANREAYRFSVPSQIGRTAISKLEEPMGEFAQLIHQLENAHFADNWGECNDLEAKIDELLTNVEHIFPDSAENIWHYYMEELDEEIKFIVPNLSTFCITSATPDSELRLIADTLDSSSIWTSRENFVIDSNYSYLVEIRERLIDEAEEIEEE